MIQGWMTTMALAGAVALCAPDEATQARMRRAALLPTLELELGVARTAQDRHLARARAGGLEATRRERQRGERWRWRVDLSWDLLALARIWSASGTRCEEVGDAWL